jgi:hypothetical protein
MLLTVFIHPSYFNNAPGVTCEQALETKTNSQMNSEQPAGNQKERHRKSHSNIQPPSTVGMPMRKARSQSASDKAASAMWLKVLGMNVNASNESSSSSASTSASQSAEQLHSPSTSHGGRRDQSFPQSVNFVLGPF